MSSARDQNWLATKDIYALEVLQPLLNKGRFLPFTGAGLRPLCLLHVANNIVINQRKMILEFGSGTSTIIIGRLIHSNDLDAKLISVEHNELWAAQMTRLIELEGLQEIITIIHAPLTPNPLAIPPNQWYDATIVNNALNSEVDMVIVDGPPAWDPKKKESRFPALPFVFSKLGQRSVVYLDDVDRAGEKKVINRWEKLFNIRFIADRNAFAHFTKGESFYVEPMR